MSAWLDKDLFEFLLEVASEVHRARELFPTNKYMLAALSEEAGEVANALIEHSRGTLTDKDVWEECVQTAAMAVRVALEGDPSFSYPGKT